MLGLVPEHDPSIEEKHKTTTYNSDDSHDWLLVFATLYEKSLNDYDKKQTKNQNKNWPLLKGKK